MEESNERSPLVDRDLVAIVNSTTVSTSRTTKVYKRRWYVLTVFTALSVIYNMAWNTWGPIQEPCKIAFGWSDFNLLLLSSWAAIGLLVSSAPLTWLMDTKGLRIAVLFAAFVSVAGKSLQVLPFSNQSTRTIFINFGQFLVMCAGPVALGAPPLVSATWFPPSERTTATAIGTLAGYIGLALAFSVGPAMVPSDFDGVSISNATDIPQTVRTLMKDNVMQYTYFEIGLCTVVFFCILVYFPSKPPLPPSVTSLMLTHTSTTASLKQLLKHGKFWWLTTLCGLSFGIYYGWLSMLDVFLAKFDVDPMTAGWLGCSATLAGMVSGIVLARCADVVKTKTKQLLMFLLAGSMVFQLIFSLSCATILPPTKPILYSSIILGGFFYNGTLPLFFELAMECVYPVGEGIAGAILVTGGNVVLLLFYVMFMLPHSDIRWMNWVTVGGTGFCSLGLLAYKERYTRLDLDIENDSEENTVRSLGTI